MRDGPIIIIRKVPVSTEQYCDYFRVDSNGFIATHGPTLGLLLVRARRRGHTKGPPGP